MVSISPLLTDFADNMTKVCVRLLPGRGVIPIHLGQNVQILPSQTRVPH
jgi:hypothetical protein